MGRMLNPKKKKMLSTKQRKELQEQGISVSYDERSDHIAIPIKNPCSGKEFFSMFEPIIKGYRYEDSAKEYQPIPEDPPVVEELSIVEEPPTHRPSGYFNGLPESLEEILKRIKDEDSPGRCNDLWKEGDW